MVLQRLKLWSRRQTLQWLIFASSSVILEACTPLHQGFSGNELADSKPSPSMSFSLGVTTWIGLTPLLIALKKGFFEELGLRVDLKTFGYNPDYISAFLAGKLDAIAPVTSEAVLLATKGKDYRIVLVEDNSVGGDGILARNSISSIKDFKGKKIAVEKGAVSHFFLLKVLTAVGLSEGDVTLVNVDPAGAAAAYQVGNVDIAVTYAPFLKQANLAQPDGRIIYDSSQIPTAITDVYLFATEYIEANPEAVEAFVKGVFKGLGFLNQYPSEGLAIAAKELKIEPDALAADLKGISLPDARANLEMLGNKQSDSYLLEPLMDVARFLAKQGKIDTIPDMEQFLEPKFVKAALERY